MDVNSVISYSIAAISLFIGGFSSVNSYKQHDELRKQRDETKQKERDQENREEGKQTAILHTIEYRISDLAGSARCNRDALDKHETRLSLVEQRTEQAHERIERLEIKVDDINKK
jgi:hypothetical protein